LRHSLYWDDFNKRIVETVAALSDNVSPPIRRVAVFITESCNFRCEYCKSFRSGNSLSREAFEEIVDKHHKDAIIHITGGEPSTVKWLYPYLESRPDVRFHLNTNAFILPPLTVKRLKVSLDSSDESSWDALVGRKGAFQKVVENIRIASRSVVTSITFTLTHANMGNVIDFIDFANREFPDLYALFFSVYKGRDSSFAFTDEDVEFFFNSLKPNMLRTLDQESRALLEETIDEKLRLIQGVRFPENSLDKPCYISLTERVYRHDGKEFLCSHLYRDGVTQSGFSKHPNCEYGCNRRLVAFNEEVEKRLTGSDLDGLISED
jgi:MoaA/NifB/PqqE/SkfB family radical SAM enzyme